MNRTTIRNNGGLQCCERSSCSLMDVDSSNVKIVRVSSSMEFTGCVNLLPTCFVS